MDHELGRQPSHQLRRPPCWRRASYPAPTLSSAILLRFCYRFRFDERTRVYQVRGVADGDTDNDGLPDTWERANELDPARSSDACGNPDRDLYSNIEEYRYGLNPQLYDLRADRLHQHDPGGEFQQLDRRRQQHAPGYQPALHLVVQETTLVSRARAGSSSPPTAAGPSTGAMPTRPSPTSRSAAPPIPTPSTPGLRIRSTALTASRSTRRRGITPSCWPTRIPTGMACQTGGSRRWWGPDAGGPAGNPDGDLYLNYEEYLYNTSISVWNPPQANVTTMAVAGTMNGWKTVSNMTLVYHHTWRCETNLVQPAGMEFKFAANNGWTFNWGDGDQVDQDVPLGGTAHSNAANIKANGMLGGLYWFTFRDDTAEYSLDYSPYRAFLSPGAAPGPRTGWSCAG